MLRGSFIAPREIRDQRDLTRLRVVRVEHAVKVGNEFAAVAGEGANPAGQRGERPTWGKRESDDPGDGERRDQS
ncbi:hypothetical protein SBA3_1510041 [Candidatus Sulfopaludibacter sp. SbA3]|nr:hypothetical protein SBA3_1510041 [Candidatus Sulfopaludibacter sp. SbA3]